MKIKPQDYEILKEFVAPYLTAERRTQYEQAGLSETRFLFDSLYASRIKIGDGIGLSGDVLLYAYCDNSHIKTALRHIASSLHMETS